MRTDSDDRASRHFGRARILHGALSAALLGATLVAYGGCSSSASSSPPPPASDDSGPTTPTPDSGAVNSTMPGDAASMPDTAAADTSAPADSGIVDGPSDGPGDATAAVDCTADDAGAGLFNHLECTGLYSNWATKTIAPGNTPYTPGYVLWSDNANKARYVYLPPGSVIDTTDMDNWVFPTGTKIWKEFSLGPQRVETRLFMKTGTGVGDWVYTTYRWSADGETTATKLDNGETNVNGTSYEIPAHGQCLQCHGGRPDMVLGLDAITLGASTAVGLPLSSLIAANAFTTNPPASVEIPEDETGRARATFGWLHVNCGVACHNANPSALANGTGLFLKTSAAQVIAGGGSTPLTQIDPYVTSVNVVPRMTAFASQGYLRINPGNPSLSLIPTLDSARNNPDVPQMPPIITHIADTTDVSKMITWIATMPIPDAGPGDSGTPDGSTDAAADAADGSGGTDAARD